jgi:hypothetical protein
MIGGYFHKGSGIGNQLHRYVATRVRATDLGVPWGMIGVKNFKAASFMPIDTGKEMTPSVTYFNPTEVVSDFPMSVWNEKVVRDEFNNDIRGYDPEFNFIEDNTIIDGEFQDERYFEHRIDDVREWLAVEPREIADDVCVVGFRGGEYTLFPDLFLPQEWWDTAMQRMREKYPAIRFEVHTDDPQTAQQFFHEMPIIQDAEINWRSVRYARHLIIANSSFYILPSLLNQNVAEVIAPRYWARHNTRVWALPQNFYKKFTYI